MSESKDMAMSALVLSVAAVVTIICGCELGTDYGPMSETPGTVAAAEFEFAAATKGLDVPTIQNDFAGHQQTPEVRQPVAAQKHELWLYYWGREDHRDCLPCLAAVQQIPNERRSLVEKRVETGARITLGTTVLTLDQQPLIVWRDRRHTIRWSWGWSEASYAATMR